MAPKVFEYRDHEMKDLRTKYGYRKTQVKSADKFTAHCSDSLALARDVYEARPIVPGVFLVLDDAYRPKRRGLHDTPPAKSGIREPRGTVFGLRKGLVIGLPNIKSGHFCGEYKGNYRCYDAKGKRGFVKRVHWISSHFNTRRSGDSPFGWRRQSPRRIFMDLAEFVQATPSRRQYSSELHGRITVFFLILVAGNRASKFPRGISYEGASLFAK